METPMNFDPNTGQPLTQEGANIRAQQYAESMGRGDIPTAPMPAPIQPKKKTGLIVGIVIAAVALLLIVAIVVVALFLVGNSKNKVALAISNTIKEVSEENKLINVLDVSDITDKGKYTVNVDIDTEISELGDMAVFTEVAIDNDQIQVSGDVDVSIIPPVEYAVQIDDKQVRAYVPLIEDYLFIYDYYEENNGYINELVDTKILNDGIKELYNSAFAKDSQEVRMREDLIESLMEEYEKLKVEKAKKEKFTIDGKTVKCKGYKIVLTEEFVDAVSDNTEEILVKYYKDVFDMAGDDIYEAIDDMTEALKELRGTEIVVYIYKNKLAAVKLEEDGEVLEILFEGGSYRAQNVRMLVDDEEVLSIEGNSDKDTEEMKINLDGEPLFSYDYNASTGELGFKASDGFDEYSFDMVLSRKNKGMYVDIGYIDLGDTYLGGTLSITEGVSMKDLSGEEFDLGEASEEEFMDLEKELYAVLMGLIGW